MINSEKEPIIIEDYTLVEEGIDSTFPTLENCKKIIKKFNPNLETLTQEDYKKILKLVKQGKEQISELNEKTHYLIYDYIATIYVKRNLNLDTFEDALAESYLITNDIFKNIQEFPKDFDMYAKRFRRLVKNRFKNIDRRNKRGNADLNFPDEKIARNIEDVTNDKGKFVITSRKDLAKEEA